MTGNLRFALTALTWAVILLAIYAITARAQTRGPLHGAAGVGWVAQAGAPGLPVLKGRQASVTVDRSQQQVPAPPKAPSTVTRRSL